MKKELIISIVIFILIIIGNIITQNYTKESVLDLSNNLENLKENISLKIEKKENDKENNQNNFDDNKELLEEINNITKNWESRHNKLAYYIEHNELEKVEDNLTGLNSLVETEEYNEALKELDKSIFILKHIEEKYKFNLENIF